MANPRRVALFLAAGHRPSPPFPRSSPTGRTRSAVCKVMFWLFIPAIYFYIGPCFGLLNNLSPCHMRNMFIAISLLVANILNLVVAPQAVGALSRLVRRRPCGVDAASLRARAPCASRRRGFWAAYHLWLASRTIVEDQRARDRLHAGPGRPREAVDGQGFHGSTLAAVECAARVRGRRAASELHGGGERAADFAERPVAARDRARETDRRTALRAPPARAGADQGRPASARRR